MRIAVALVCGIMSVGTVAAQPAAATDRHLEIQAPVSCENLAVFMITGQETLPDSANYVMLAEAMEKKLVESPGGDRCACPR